MRRVVEKDQFGCDVEYKMPETKVCPVCRREVELNEIEYIKDEFKKHPEVG
jgi:hypothetical protein